MKSEYRNYSIVMFLCFIVGGFAILLFLSQMYDAFIRTETLQRFNMTEFEPLNMTGPPRMNVREFGNPLASPFSFSLLLSGIVLLLAGFSLWHLTRDKELRSTKEKLTSLLLLPEERTVILELKKSKGAMTQSQLVKNTGMSKVKAHRIVSRLAAKGIIKKYPYGLTNKIVLEKEV